MGLNMAERGRLPDNTSDCGRKWQNVAECGRMRHTAAEWGILQQNASKRSKTRMDKAYLSTTRPNLGDLARMRQNTFKCGQAQPTEPYGTKINQTRPMRLLTLNTDWFELVCDKSNWVHYHPTYYE